jgi:hypothetical protein
MKDPKAYVGNVHKVYVDNVRTNAKDDKNSLFQQANSSQKFEKYIWLHWIICHKILHNVVKWNDTICTSKLPLTSFTQQTL